MRLQGLATLGLAAFVNVATTARRRVRIGEALSDTGSPNGGVPQGTLSGPKDFLVHINDLTTPCPTYKYVDDSTISSKCVPQGLNLDSGSSGCGLDVVPTERHEY